MSPTNNQNNSSTGADQLDIAKLEFINLLQRIKSYEQLHSFAHFANDAIESLEQELPAAHTHATCDSTECTEHANHIPLTDKGKHSRLQRIVRDLRAKLPVTAESPEEKIVIPTTSENFASYTPDNTVHVDGFLYTEDDVDGLCDSGALSRNYCRKCGSKEPEPLNFISHSASVIQLDWLFNQVFNGKVAVKRTGPAKKGKKNVRLSAEGKVVLDVGSRLGAVLYAGYIFSDAKKLIGVEMNEYFCGLQKEMIEKHRMSDRVEIICSDILNQAAALKTADIVVMNNVFQFFTESKEKQVEIWEFLRAGLRRSGVILVTVPSLEEQFEEAGVEIEIAKWVKKLDLNMEDLDQRYSQEDVEELENVHIYQVL